MIGFGRERGIKFNSLGSLTLNASGELTGGSAFEIGVDKKRFTGGKLLISDRGSLSGVIDTYLADTDTREIYEIFGGQMTSEKDIVVFAGKFPTDRRGIVVLIAQKMTSVQADLAGTWVVLHDRVYALNIDREGAITECAIASEGRTGKGACEGTFSLDPAGAVSARMLFSAAQKQAVTISGQLNAGRNFMALTGSDSAHLEGITLPFMRREGTFSIGDMEGLWWFSMTGHNGTLFGTLRTDNKGTVLEGAWSRIGGGGRADEAGVIAEGTFSLTEKGEISGSLKTSGGDVYEIPGGQMGPKKDMMDALYSR